MTLSANRTIILKMSNQSQLTHFQKDILTYTSFIGRDKFRHIERCISHESEDAIKMCFLNQKYMLSKMHAKRFTAEWEFAFCFACFVIIGKN